VIGGLLEESLKLWRVAGAVEADGEGALVRAAGRVVRITRGRASRWVVSVDGEDARTTASVVGVLSAVREILGVSRGTQVRIAPGRGQG
jgi:hypothetical protein